MRALTKDEIELIAGAGMSSGMERVTVTAGGPPATSGPPSPSPYPSPSQGGGGGGQQAGGGVWPIISDVVNWALEHVVHDQQKQQELSNRFDADRAGHTVTNQFNYTATNGDSCTQMTLSNGDVWWFDNTDHAIVGAMTTVNGEVFMDTGTGWQPIGNT